MPDYLVKITAPIEPGAEAKTATTERLVRAKNQAQALSHVTNGVLAVSIAETEDILRCASYGVKLETAE